MRASSRLTWDSNLCHVVPHPLVDELALTHGKAIDEPDAGVGRPVEKLAVERAEAVDAAVECVETLVGFARAAVALFGGGDQLLERVEARTARKHHEEAGREECFRGCQIAPFHGGEVFAHHLLSLAQGTPSAPSPAVLRSSSGG